MEPPDIDHLYFDGHHYDRLNERFQADLPFYLAQIERHGGPVLELACGSGRLTVPLAERGIDITGLDASPTMLARAREKAAARGVDLPLIQGDMRCFDLGRRYRIIFIPFNSLNHIHHWRDIIACFACVRRHLEERGLFILHLFNPDLRLLLRDPRPRYPVARYPDPYVRRTVVITENNAYDGAQQINRVRWYFNWEGEDEERVEALDLRMIYPQELEVLLHYGGFSLETRYGWFDCSPFTSNSRSQIVLARPRSSEGPGASTR